MQHALAIAATLCACIDTPPLHEPDVVAAGSIVHERAEGLRPKLDVLIVLDTSSVMTEYGADLARLRGQLAHHLGSLTHQWTDLRVAVTGNGGAFLLLAGSATTYLADAWTFDYARQRNFDGTLGEALNELVRVDAADGAAAQPLEAMRQALEHNGLFVRDDATLAVLIVSAGDDASPLPIEEYARWTDALAGSGGWLRRQVVIAGIHPPEVPRLDAYYKRIGSVQATRTAALADGDHAEVIALLRPIPRGWWSFAAPICIDRGDLDPRTPTIEHECTMEARFDAAALHIPECTSPEPVAASELHVTAPAASCWRLVRGEQNCWPGSLGFAMQGYTNLSHPAFRLECRTR